MHFNAVTYLENLEKMNQVDELIDKRGGHDAVEAVIRKSEVPGNHLPLPIMRDRFVKRCLFILKKSEEPMERANVLRQMSKRSMTLNSS